MSDIIVTLNNEHEAPKASMFLKHYNINHNIICKRVFEFQDIDDMCCALEVFQCESIGYLIP